MATLTRLRVFTPSEFRQHEHVILAYIRKFSSQSHQESGHGKWQEVDGEYDGVPERRHIIIVSGKEGTMTGTYYVMLTSF